MSFSKNWKQWIVSKGEPFQIEYLDRKFRGKSKVVFKVDDQTGAVTVNGKALNGDQNFTGNLVTTGNADFGGTLGVDGNTTLDGSLSVGTTLAVTGVSTFTGQAKLPVSSFHKFYTAGADASGGATHITATGVKIGDKVLFVANTTDGALSADFEATVTVNDQIQQATTNLSAKKLLILVLAQS